MSCFYVIDAFQTILGITDEEGMLVCKYSYSAYGIVSITMDTGGIGALNPIIYKGYYYDNERQLYCISNIYYSPTLARFIQPIDISNLNISNINGLNLYNYANNNPIHKADKNPIFSSLLKFEQNILQNDFVSEIHYKSKFFVLEKFDFFVFDKKKVALIDGEFSVYAGSLYFDNAETRSLYNRIFKVSGFVGYNIEKDKYGVELGGSVGILVYDGRFIDVQVDFLTIKFFFIYEDGKLKIDPGFGLIDFGISIDVAAIIDYLKGKG